MPAYTLTIAIDPPLKLYIAAHNDAGAMVMAREHVDREFTAAERDEAVLTAMVVGERQGWSAVLEHDREDGRAIWAGHKQEWDCYRRQRSTMKTSASKAVATATITPPM